jgi:hypothetical protein
MSTNGRRIYGKSINLHCDEGVFINGENTIKRFSGEVEVGNTHGPGRARLAANNILGNVCIQFNDYLVDIAGYTAVDDSAPLTVQLPQDFWPSQNVNLYAPSLFFLGPPSVAHGTLRVTISTTGLLSAYSLYNDTGNKLFHFVDGTWDGQNLSFCFTINYKI